MLKNTENPQMLVYYFNKIKNEITAIANSEDGTYSLVDFYKTIRPALIEAPSKPYTNNKVNYYASVVKRGRANPKSQAKGILYILERNETLKGYGGGERKDLEPKVILSDAELNLLEAVTK